MFKWRSPDFPAHVLPAAVALAAWAFVWVRPLKVLGDPDTYWHIAAGRWMLAHLQVPHADPFSGGMPGAAWVPHEWLSEILLTLSDRAGGWEGVVALTAAAFAMTMALLARHLARFLPLPVCAFLVLFGMASVAPSLLARPHILALPALELWTAGLVLARAARRPPPWWLLAVMPLWANLHGSFFLGLVLIVPFAAEAVWAEAPAARLPVLARWASFAVFAIVVACLTPNGVAGLLHPVRMMRMHTMLESIGEWRSPDFQHIQALELWLAVFVYAVASRGLKLPPLRVLLLLALLHLGLEHARNAMLIGILGPLVIAEPLGAWKARPTSGRSAAVPWAVFVIVAAVLVRPVIRGDDRMTPAAALAHLPTGMAAMPVLNDYDFGGYLIYRGIRPYIDGRADMYGDAFLGEYEAALRPDRVKLVHLLNARHIAWTLLRPTDGAVAVLDLLPGWRRLYADNVAVIHVRVPGGPGVLSALP